MAAGAALAAATLAKEDHLHGRHPLRKKSSLTRQESLFAHHGSKVELGVEPDWLEHTDNEHTPWINTDAAESVFGGLIMLNSVVLGIDVEVGLRNGGDSGVVLFWIQFGFLVIFVIELIMRIAADGLKFLRNFAGLFDAFIILASVAENVMAFMGTNGGGMAVVSIMRVFRLLRLARIMRVLRIFPELALLVSGLAASMQAVFWVFCFLIVIMYICSLICAMELGQEDVGDPVLREAFGSLGASFYTHFMIVTLEGYPAITKSAALQSRFWYFYIVVFIIFSNMVLMNLVTGIVCESVMSYARNEELANCQYEGESSKFAEVLSDILTNLGYDSEVEISFSEFQSLIRDPYVRETLNIMEICLDIGDHDFFQILDEDGSGSLTWQELFTAFFRLRGSKETVHSLLVQCDVVRSSQALKQHIRDSEAAASVYASSLLTKLEGTLRKSFATLKHEVSEASRAGEAILSRAASGEDPRPWSQKRRFRVHSDEELTILRKHVYVFGESDVSSVRSAVSRLNVGSLECTEGCCLVYSKTSRAYFLLYRRDAEASAHEALALLEPTDSGDAVLCQGKGVDCGQNEDELPCPPCVQASLESIETATAEAGSALEELIGELEASRERVRDLEEFSRSRAAQTDSVVSPDVHQLSASRESSPLWIEQPLPAAQSSSPARPEPSEAAPKSEPPSKRKGDRGNLAQRRTLENTYSKLTSGAASPATGSPNKDDVSTRLLDKYHKHSNVHSPGHRNMAMLATCRSSDDEAGQTRGSARER